MIVKVVRQTEGVFILIQDLNQWESLIVLERWKSMFTYVVGEDIEFFGLILSFQFIKELKL